MTPQHEIHCRLPRSPRSKRWGLPGRSCEGAARVRGAGGDRRAHEGSQARGSVCSLHPASAKPHPSLTQLWEAPLVAFRLRLAHLHHIAQAQLCHALPSDVSPPPTVTLLNVAQAGEGEDRSERGQGGAAAVRAGGVRRAVPGVPKGDGLPRTGHVQARRFLFLRRSLSPMILRQSTRATPLRPPQ